MTMITEVFEGLWVPLSCVSNCPRMRRLPELPMPAMLLAENWSGMVDCEVMLARPNKNHRRHRSESQTMTKVGRTQLPEPKGRRATLLG